MSEIHLDLPVLLRAAMRWETVAAGASDVQRSLRTVQVTCLGPRVEPALTDFVTTWEQVAGRLASQADAHAVSLRQAAATTLVGDHTVAARFGELLDGPGA